MPRFFTHYWSWEKNDIERICDADAAAAILGCKPEQLWEAEEHIIAAAATLVNSDASFDLLV